MRIAIDARELAGKTTGVGRYLRGLLGAWALDPRARAHEWVLYAHEPVERDTPVGDLRQLPGSGGTWWEQRVLASALRRDRPAVLFAPAYTAPIFLDLPRVVTIHDLSYHAHPEWFRAREGARRRLLTARSAAAARAVLTVSEFSKREIAERLGVPRDRIHVVYHGLPPPPRAEAAARPFVLFVGSVFNRRHVPDLIRGFAQVARAHPGVDLEIVGDNRTYPYQSLDAIVRSEDLDGRVRVRAYVDEPTLNELYGSARAFAFLSEYEGFGITPLEALNAGAPPLLLDTPVARETCGDGAEYVTTLDPASVAHGLERTLFDEAVRERVRRAAPAVVARYRWDTAASETLAVLERAAS
jgi:glycosyltransferase involved in cell wall biosynthesis